MKVQNRHTIPGKFNFEEFLTLWKFQKPSGTVVIYIQISPDQMKPKWARYGSILEIALKDQVVDEEFVQTCISKYKEWLDSTHETSENETD